jgi:hypothetical protein
MNTSESCFAYPLSTTQDAERDGEAAGRLTDRK